MKKIIFTTPEHKNLKTDHELRIICEDQLLNDIRIFQDLVDVEIATTELEIARIAGIDYFDGENFQNTDNNNFYKNTPDWLKEKHKRIVNNSVKVTQDVNRIVIDDVEQLDLKQMAKDGGVYVIHVPTGKKKTKAVAQPLFKNAIENGEKATAVTPLISICKSFHQNAENNSGNSIAYYDSLTQADLKKNGMVTTINSSSKPSIINHSKDSDIIIFEEFCASLDVVAESKELRANRMDIWNNLKDTIQNTKTVILLDADFNDNYINFIKSAGRTPTVIEIAPDYSDINVNLHEHGQLVHKMVNAANNNKKILITTDSKKGAEEYAKLFKGKDGVLMIHAENKGLEKQKAFLNNPNDNLDDVEVLIYSPVMNRSISIEKEHFDEHYAIFNGVLTPVSCIQQMRRDRTAKTFDICIKSQNLIGYLDDVDQFEVNEKVLSEIRESNRYLKQSIATSLPITLEALKFNVTRAAYNEEQGKQGFKAASSAAKEVKEEYVAGVKVAKEITLEEANSRKGRDDLTNGEIHERDAKLISNMTGEITDNSISFYGHGAGVKKINILNFANMTKEQANRFDGSERKLAECDRSNAIFYSVQLPKIFDFIDADGVYQFDGNQALRIVNNLKRLKLTNKTGLIRLEEKSKYSEAMAITMVTKFIKAFGFTVKTRKDKNGNKVKRIENIDNVARYFKHSTGKDLFLVK